MSKRENENKEMSALLQAFIEKNKLEGGLNKVEVKDAWVNMMGPGVNNYTTAILLRNETLYVSLTSSVLREELSYGTQKIIDMLNEALGKPLIKKLVLK